ncbi:MAG: UDP-N-acetylglucosamine diphosphorylase/glucosamine-1-phosphate N-acetyltransferase [Thermobacillus sp. ZCTH02-B1]|uniref:bifunctional UDP-N-acetylglucosamine diphosphorylase/glucosamine-1-phosphate N-acetyltransferase GlmU n=1 Tax=Thermobacillus sp. ZCTH02-B1 TaxID=1858795 RepID=UPI000B584F26|nr:bifunctional UDP-N-acetylglucosamine diphosphorylase/glucosamine-1-phosphate N-acetyltransferase GlmU [Thermobacillus sp. ZCTH02-B1]OUM95553.1 MAG: UDP-N-acetylglucosamine diphosphorylase/glucosamine-1-phosphate N-acetyltransferase [Thermobacillus sp. ZCTH02-B1]
MERMAVVLAAGLGKRMKSKRHKVLHPVCGKPMLGHVLDVAAEAGCGRTIVIVGHGADAVRSYVGDRAECVLQAEQLGTGHAVLQAGELIGGEEGTTVVICGDTPLIRPETIRAMLEEHERAGAAATMLTAVVPDPAGLGRVIRGKDGRVERIVEHRDCTPDELRITEINAGTYCFDNRKLFEALGKVKNDNAQGEYYLTDVIGILHDAGETIAAYRTPDPAEAAGVNDRIALAEAERLMRERINRRHMEAGVTIIDPQTTYIDAGVEIGADTVIWPGTILRGRTVIGEDCVVGPQADITDSVIGRGVTVRHSVLLEAEVGDGCTIGPYAHLRPGSKLAAGCRIGDFVELKNAKLGEGTKVPHLSYVGDAIVGRDVNFGCGAITVNYDGYNKSVTEIGDRAFIGSNVNLIAPVKIGEDAYVVAGSTITHDVKPNDMAIARERQINKEGYAEKLRARARAKKERLSRGEGSGES